MDKNRTSMNLFTQVVVVVTQQMILMASLVTHEMMVTGLSP